MSVEPGRALRMSYVVASVAGVGFFVLSVLLLGIWPGKVLEDEVAKQSPAKLAPLTASEEHGRRIYAREGCAYCHTQQIRYVEPDVMQFGAATLAWETSLDYPHLWGTRRIGPDLSREAGVRTADWQLAHLYNPRLIVEGSVMPGFPHLFAGDPRNPMQEARDLLGYLDTLGRARALAAPEGEAHARQGCNCASETERYAFPEEGLQAHPARSLRGRNHPGIPPTGNAAEGGKLFEVNCATCHGTNGNGDGPGASALSPSPTNLIEHAYTNDRLAEILWNGRYGTAMNAWREMSTEQMGNLAAFVRTLPPAVPEPTIPAATIALGARVYKEHCVQCHEESGAGDGSASREFPIGPPDFRGQRPSIAAALKAVREGVPGTPMAPWATKLPEAEVSAAAYYVRTFFTGGAN
jgi:cbb3-type cytochrome oxidase cytochrome c subunit/cytochrome c553